MAAERTPGGPGPADAALPPPRDESPRISIMMPTRNEGDRVRKTIDSLLANTFYVDFEVLVLDDASTDGSCDFLSAPPYAGDGRLRRIRHESQQGYLALRIEGARLATGEVFQFLDAHHSFHPFWLSNLHGALQRRNYAAVVGAVTGVLDPETWRTNGTVMFGWHSSASLTKGWPARAQDVGPGGRVDWFATHQMMVSRRVYEEVGGFWPHFEGHGTEDPDFCLRAFLLGYDCFVEPTAAIGHLYKKQFINPVTWDQLMLNYLTMAYLIFGPERFDALREGQRSQHGYEKGVEKFEAQRPRIAEFRQWIERRQRRSGEELARRLKAD
jgi:glycosyltransferase involved in cell wall biosynthesis